MKTIVGNVMDELISKTVENGQREGGDGTHWAAETEIYALPCVKQMVSQNQL